MESETVTMHHPDRPVGEGTPEFEALQRVIGALGGLSRDAQVRILQASATFLDVGLSTPSSRLPARGAGGTSMRSDEVAYSADTAMSPKEFLLEKQPRTDVERIACLAYYLTHFRELPHFKTIDISKLNTEAAQPKFANAANASGNAVKTGYLVASIKGQRQISAAGERFVQQLPDRDAARIAMESVRKRRKPRRAKSTRTAKPA